MRQSFTKYNYVCGRSLRFFKHGEIPEIVGGYWSRRMNERWKIKQTKHTIMKVERIMVIKAWKIQQWRLKKLEQKLAIKANEEHQSDSNTIWEKMVKKNCYSISCYNSTLYLILTEKLNEINKLIIPINQDNHYKLGIILPNLIYNYTHNNINI